MSSASSRAKYTSTAKLTAMYTATAFETRDCANGGHECKLKFVHDRHLPKPSEDFFLTLQISLSFSKILRSLKIVGAIPVLPFLVSVIA